MSGQQYDISPEERRRLEEKAKQRAILRQEYIKQLSNPHKYSSGEGFLFDSGIQRFMSMRATGYDTFTRTGVNAAWSIGVVVIPIVLVAWMFKSTRDKKEHQYRTGQVAYKDRKFIFQ